MACAFFVFAAAKGSLFSLNWVRAFVIRHSARKRKVSSSPLPLGLIFAQLFFGVLLSEFSLGLLSVIFVEAVCRWRQGKYLVEFARFFFLFGFVGVA